MGKHSAQRRSPMPLVLGVVALLAIAAAAFFGFRILTGTDSPSQAAPLPTTSTSGTPSTTTSATSTTTTAASATVSAELAAVQKALQECVTRQDAAQRVVTAATTAAEHWSEHVQGQADIDSGAKTYLDVKTNVFGPSRAAGPGDVAAYDGAMTAYSGVGGCQNVGTLEAPTDLKTKLQACAAREQAIDTYMSAAKAVLDDWRTHLSEMADHSDGHLDGPEAQARWIQRYRAAPAHLDPYKSAAAALSSAPACSA
ncbi:MAG TPA: hypothetical protein VIG79_17125 [Lapillicoccus sp.]|uniref:hypothetical protein n=1 Tax=Lapillicoccus sp. TaxID=1909287 RepID=UPI002F921054